MKMMLRPLLALTLLCSAARSRAQAPAAAPIPGLGNIAVTSTRIADLTPEGVTIAVDLSLTAARTVDAVWHAAGDTSADFSWYTKRAILAGVYSTTLLYWLRDTSDDDAPTLAFLDRRLAGVARIGRLRRRIDGIASRFVPSPLRAA